MKNNHLNIKTSHFSNNKFSQKHNHKGGKKKYKTLKAYKSYRSLKGGEPSQDTIEKINKDIQEIEKLLDEITNEKESKKDKPIVNTFKEFMDTKEYSLKQWEAVTDKLLVALNNIKFNTELNDLKTKKEELLDKIRTLNRTILTEVIDDEIKSNLNTKEDQEAALKIFKKYLQGKPNEDISTEIEGLTNSTEFDIKLSDGENKIYNTLKSKIIEQIKKDLNNILKIKEKLTNSSSSISSVQNDLSATAVPQVSEAAPIKISLSSTQPDTKISLASEQSMGSDKIVAPAAPPPPSSGGPNSAAAPNPWASPAPAPAAPPAAPAADAGVALNWGYVSAAFYMHQ